MQKIEEKYIKAGFLTPNIMPNYKVYKSNKIIECKSDFSATEHRIIVLALAQITPKDENLKMYRINIQDVLGGKKSASNYETVRNAVKKLHKSTIDVEEIDGWKSYSFITMAQGKYRESFIEIQFHEHVQKFLLGMKSQYTTYTVANVINFKKCYSLRIYELCKQYARIGQRRMDLNYLRTLFCLEKKHLDFYEFKRKVLNPALEEINKYSDICVDFKEIKKGNKVSIISFFICRNKKVLNEESVRTLEEVAIVTENNEKLLSIGFNDDNILDMRKQYGNERITTVLDLFEKNIDTIKFPKPWVENALKENYSDTSVYKKKLEQEKEKYSQKETFAMKKMKAKSELCDLEYHLERAEQDLQYYETFGELKSGDIMRFDDNFTVEQAILYAKKRIKDIKEQRTLLKTKIQEMETLLDLSRKE